MAYASKSGRARTNPRRPEAFAVCDRCGFWNNRTRLSFQFEYAGAGLINKQLLVCRRCKDKPQPQLQARVIGPDPVPVINARTEPFTIDEA